MKNFEHSVNIQFEFKSTPLDCSLNLASESLAFQLKNMLLVIVAIVLVTVFLATRYGIKSASPAIRILSYIGVFISIAVLVFLTVSSFGAN